MNNPSKLLMSSLLNSELSNEDIDSLEEVGDEENSDAIPLINEFICMTLLDT